MTYCLLLPMSHHTKPVKYTVAKWKELREIANYGRLQLFFAIDDHSDHPDISSRQHEFTVGGPLGSIHSLFCFVRAAICGKAQTPGCWCVISVHLRARTAAY